MTKLKSEFFTDGKILFWDQTEKGLFCPISKNVIKVIEEQGIEVYKVDTGNAETLNNMKKLPRSAYVLCEKSEATDIVRRLEEKGIQRILFHPFLTPDSRALTTCKEHNIETIIGCPNMLFGKGICKIHASFAEIQV